ncbi:hypothetical protein J132_00664 [Termitomyces sp. J132]|nr:hypothetical protein J132_00664 [Termitomyces sp. J132]
MISHQIPAPFPLITQPPTPSLPQISCMAFCLNPAKTVLFPHNPTSPDLPGSVWITAPQLPVQATRARNIFECSVTNAGESRPPTNLKPGSKAVLSLLGQVDAALKTVQLADDNTLLPHANLQKHREAVQLTAQQQLYSLDIALQVYKLISVCLARLDKTLGPSDVECTGDLLNNLQVSPEIVDSDSNIEITPSSPKNPCPPVLVQEAATL